MNLAPEKILQQAIAEHKEGKLQKAERLYRIILKSNPKHPDANYNLGLLAARAGRIEAALPYFKTALKASSEKSQFWVSYINALIKLDQEDNARQVLKQWKETGVEAEEIDHLEAQLVANTEAKSSMEKSINGLVILFNQGKLREILAQENVLALQFPNNPIISNIIGAANAGLGSYEEAVTNYNHAIALAPNFADAHNNLAVVLKNLGKHEESIIAYKRTLDLKPDDADVHSNLGIALSLFEAANFSQQFADIYYDILEKKTIVSPSNMVGPIVKLLKHHPKILEALQSENFDHLKTSAVKICSNLSEIPLFLKIMELCPIPDLEIEHLLKKLRKTLLFERPTFINNEGLLSFQSALALQCFTNEFIYGETEDETEEVGFLEGSLHESVSNNVGLSTYQIACLASYRPLYKYIWAKDLIPPVGLEMLFSRQIAEVEQEEKFRTTISKLTPIEDKISLAVQTHYEENPYPRWVNAGLPSKSLSIADIATKLELRITNKGHQISERPDILIAGCGTGQHALEVASRFKNSNVLAVDLSLRSLSYAKRKTEELSFTNIEYMQADILNLGMLNKKFHAIESLGVLHHMADPVAGWRVLSDCLKPGGLMKIALYSKTGRQEIEKVRSIVAENDISNSEKNMLMFRQRAIQSGDPILKAIFAYKDAFSTSEFRDLLFHIQECSFTIPMINELLDELGLGFSGFEFKNKHVKNRFRELFSQPGDMVDLEKWHKFEASNPSIFHGMYQFWVQKH